VDIVAGIATVVVVVTELVQVKGNLRSEFLIIEPFFRSADKPFLGGSLALVVEGGVAG